MTTQPAQSINSVSFEVMLEELLERARAVLENERWDRLRSLLNEKQAAPGIRVLLFGAYNTGKTTLMNALAGREVFSTGPVPHTQEMQSVHFGEYEVMDSPGFEAPDPRAEQLARECAGWDADLVVFVVRHPSQHGEKQTWQELRNLVSRGKPVLFVVNESGRLEEQERKDLHESLHSQVLVLNFASQEGRIEGPVFVNASSAWRARVDGKTKLEQSSRIGILERRIQNHARRTQRVGGLATVAKQLGRALEERRRQVEASLQSSSHQDDPLHVKLGRLDQLMNQLDQEVSKEVEALIADAVQQARNIAFSDSEEAWDGFSQAVNDGQEHLLQHVQNWLKRHLEALGESIPWELPSKTPQTRPSPHPKQHHPSHPSPRPPQTSSSPQKGPGLGLVGVGAAAASAVANPFVGGAIVVLGSLLEIGWDVWNEHRRIKKERQHLKKLLKEDVNRRQALQRANAQRFASWAKHAFKSAADTALGAGYAHIHTLRRQTQSAITTSQNASDETRRLLDQLEQLTQEAHQLTTPLLLMAPNTKKP